MLSKEILFLTSVLCIIGCANDILSKTLANVYGFRYAFFVDQSCNILYCLIAALVPLIRVVVGVSRVDEEEVLKTPQRKFATMGFLDALGTLFSSIGNVGTPGKYQGAISQTLIPATMVVSASKLGSEYTRGEVLGALIVLVGAGVAVVVPALVERPEGNLAVISLPCICLFFLANIPMAYSNVYKETGFRDHHINVWEMTAITTFYQTMLSFPLAIFQLFFSGDPSRALRGYSVAELAANFRDGFRFSLGAPGLLLLGYCGVNMAFNVAGLLVTKAGAKHGLGSVLCSMAYAVKLPISSLLFSSTLLLGDFAESISVFNVLGVLVVTTGFVLYVRKAEEAVRLRAPQVAELLVEEPWAFHERVVGCVSSHVVNSNTDFNCYHRLPS